MCKTLLALYMTALSAVAMADPSFTISMDARSSDDHEQLDAASFEGSAPIVATFHYKVSELNNWKMYYEWRFCKEDGNFEEPYMIRYDESPEVTFTESGGDRIALYAYFVNEDNTDTLFFQKDYWEGPEGVPLSVKASESELVFPNAFSPNGDGINDFFRPKSHQSIVDFHATIYSRWGQKMYSWDDVKGDGWDGKFNGKDVKQGVYFIVVKAKGADGRVFEIKKDVNLLRGYTSDESTGVSSN